jgi:thiamine-phosphate diphosphorylase
LLDSPVAVARDLLGPDAIVGATTPTVGLAGEAQENGASYVAVGAIFPSPTRPDKPVVGLDRLRRVTGAVDIPVCAIGGITAERLPEVLSAGAGLAAVIGAVADSPDPLEAVQRLVAACHP